MAAGTALGVAKDRDKGQAPRCPWSPLPGLTQNWPPLSKHLLNCFWHDGESIWKVPSPSGSVHRSQRVHTNISFQLTTIYPGPIMYQQVPKP